MTHEQTTARETRGSSAALGPDATCGDLDAATPEERRAWYARLFAEWEGNTLAALADDDRVDAKLHKMNKEWA